MTRDLVINALDNAYKHVARPKRVLIHSGSGSQYCSCDYQAYLKSHGFICSMSRKGDCWDNAPMEAFWGKMKTEWLAGRMMKTLAEAKAAVFELLAYAPRSQAQTAHLSRAAAWLSQRTHSDDTSFPHPNE